ncbi:hypothetical protein [Salinisphaera sp. PC39]|uniref:hypothetical protein n=1 Tax=Salinisphaera sp. PC39 TaxID=1304156 RepID=UPI00333FB562
MRFYQTLAATLSWPLVFVSIAALAQPQLPPPGNYTLYGTISIYSAGILAAPCDTAAHVDITDSQSGTLNALGFSGSSICVDRSVLSTPNTLTKTNNTVTLKGLSISTSIGDCTGDLDGSLTISGGVTQIVYTQADSTLSGGLFGLGCAIEGHLDF